MMKQLISYAQNYEDIILSRCFKDINNGFYVDIGAYDPEIDSCTKLFYDQGWSGINVEPQINLYELFNSSRTRDININALINGVSSSGYLYVPKSTPGWASGDIETYEYFIKNSIPFDTAICKTMTLSDLFKNYANDVVHFLKIDAEGMEEVIICSHKFEKKRPWVIVVEVIDSRGFRKNSNIENFLNSVGYNLVLHDGLNDFFVSSEHSYLIKYFSLPPNIFDNFCLAREVRLQEKIKSIINIIENK